MSNFPKKYRYQITLYKDGETYEWISRNQVVLENVEDEIEELQHVKGIIDAISNGTLKYFTFDTHKGKVFFNCDLLKNCTFTLMDES